MKSILGALLKFAGVVVAVAVGTALGYAWISRDFVTISPNVVVSDRDPPSGEQAALDDDARQDPDPRGRLTREVRDQLRHECEAQIAERQELTDAGASALVSAHWPVEERTSVHDVVRIIESDGMKPADRSELYEAFGRFCAQGVEMAFFDGEEASVHWPPRKPGKPYIESLYVDKDGNEVPVGGQEQE